MKKLSVFSLFLLLTIKSYGQNLQVLLDSSSYYWDAQKYTQAFDALSRAVDASRAAYEAGSENSAYNYAYILNQMGVRLYTAESYETAESYYNAAIPIYKTLQGASGSDYLIAMENLAVCYDAHGLYQETLDIYTSLLSNEGYQQAAGNNIYQTFNSAGVCAYQIDNYDVAKEYYQKGLSFLNESIPDYWVLTENLIVLENTWGNYAEGYKYLVPFLNKFPEKETEYSNLIAYYNRDLGHVEYGNGNFVEAIPFLKNYVEYLQPTDSIDRLSAVYALEDLSSAYVNSANYAEGFSYLVKNEESVKNHYGEGSEDHMVALNNLALAASELGDYRNAQKYYKKAFRLTDKMIDPQKGEMRSLLDFNFSDYLLKIGKYTDAKTHAKRAFDFYQTNEELYFDDLVDAMNQMGILLITEGSYEKAESLLKLTLSKQQKKYGLENEMGAKIAFNLTGLYVQTGRGVRASQFLDFVLAYDLNTHGAESYEYSFSLQLAGVLYTSSGQNEDAITALEKAYEIRKKLVGEENRELLRLKQSLGTAYSKAGKLDLAESTLSEALEAQKKSIGTNNFDITLTQNDLGMVLLARKNYTDASKLFNQSYDLKKKILGSYNQFTITSLYNMACTRLLTGKKEQALDSFQEAIDNYLFVLDAYFPYLSEKERLEYYHTIVGQLGAYFSFLNEELDQHPEYASILYDTQIKTKAMLLSESMKLRNFLTNHTDPQVKQMYEKWNSINEEIANLEQYNHQGEKKIYLDSLKIVGEEYERFLNALPRVSTEKKEVSWTDIAATLKDGEVAVEVIRVKAFDFENNALNKEKITYLALIIDNKTTGSPSFIKLEEGYLMDSKYFNVYKNSIKYKQEDKLSYKAFWKPIAEKVSDYEKIYFSSDGVYHLLNLNTLYNPATSTYVINESTIEIIGNTSELSDQQASAGKPQDATLFGFPNFNTRPDASSNNELRSSMYRDIFTNGVSDLPGTKMEVTNINSLMSSSGITAQSFVSDEAHEGQLKAISSTDILHIATHGFFEESTDDVVNDDPLTHSGLLLANIKESVEIQEENGIITAKEIAQLNLQDNKLVVLSACETGKGKVVDGEGVYGLQRAFQVAGADNVIISLWKVDDAATQQLMTYFYEIYLQSNDPRSALRQAQIKLQSDYPHPNFWGAFYVVGK